jgi:hypothetical protein
MADLREMLRRMMAEQGMDPAEVAAQRQRFERIGELAMQGRIDPRAGAYHGQDFDQPVRQDDEVSGAARNVQRWIREHQGDTQSA